MCQNEKEVEEALAEAVDRINEIQRVVAPFTKGDDTISTILREKIWNKNARFLNKYHIYQNEYLSRLEKNNV